MNLFIGPSCPCALWPVDAGFGLRGTRVWAGRACGYRETVKSDLPSRQVALTHRETKPSPPFSQRRAAADDVCGNPQRPLPNVSFREGSQAVRLLSKFQRSRYQDKPSGRQCCRLIRRNILTCINVQVLRALVGVCRLDALPIERISLCRRRAVNTIRDATWRMKRG